MRIITNNSRLRSYILCGKIIFNHILVILSLKNYTLIIVVLFLIIVWFMVRDAPTYFLLYMQCFFYCAYSYLFHLIVFFILFFFLFIYTSRLAIATKMTVAKRVAETLLPFTAVFARGFFSSVIALD